mmetsp:Transcript_9541/g.20114  ORF Transcript_9541/g.20114 Transcript_9541/m.20114 type:complete len:272 (+) Transcript_9541:33-848(+)
MKGLCFVQGGALRSRVLSGRNAESTCSTRQPRMALKKPSAVGAQDMGSNDDKSQTETLKSAAGALAMSSILFMMDPLAAQAAVPGTTPTTHFLDEAGVVSRSTEPLVEKALTTLQTNTGLDVHFVLTRAFPFDTEPEEYASELFSQWGLGAKDLVIVGGTKVARAGLAAGADVKNVLSVQQMESIGNETFPVNAREDKYSAAVLDVNNRILPILYGKEDPGPPKIERESAAGTFKTKQETEKSKFKYWTVFWVLILISFIVPFVQYFWYTK